MGTERIDRNILAAKLGRRYGFDGAVFDGMTLEQLEEVQHVMDIRSGKLRGDELPQGTKAAIARSFYLRHAEALSKAGMSIDRFSEIWRRAPEARDEES